MFFFSQKLIFMELAFLIPATVDASLYNKVWTTIKPILHGKTA
jgi:hypothetical protein